MLELVLLVPHLITPFLVEVTKAQSEPPSA